KTALEQRLKAYAGKPVGVAVRSAAEMAQVLADNPFPKAKPNRTVAIFLDGKPPNDTLSAVRGQKGEEIKLGRREIYVHYGDGMGQSKLVIPAATAGTARNLNTVATLAKMAAELRSGRRARVGLQLRQPGLAAVDEIAQQRRIIGTDGAAHRWPRRQILAPLRELRLAGQNAEIADLVEDVEIAEHRPEHRIDQRKPFAVEPRPSDPLLAKRDFLLKLCSLRLQGRLILGGIETGDIVEHGGAELDPAAMLGAIKRIGRMQRVRLRLFQVFQDHGGFKDRLVADDQHRRLAERRNLQEP